MTYGKASYNMNMLCPGVFFNVVLMTYLIRRSCVFPKWFFSAWSLIIDDVEKGDQGTTASCLMQLEI